MRETEKRMYFLIVGILVIVASYTLLYKYLYGQYEGSEVGYLHSLQVVVESLTTAGFGGDAPWQSPVVSLFVTVMNLTGVSVFFITIPLAVLPFLRSTLSAPPKSTSKSDHTVVISDSKQGDSLMTELNRTDNSYVFVEPDSEKASKLYREGICVVNSEPLSREGLEQANLGQADSIIVDFSEGQNLTVLYLARQINSDVRRVSVVRSEHGERYCRQAGADEVFNVAKESGSIIGEYSANIMSPEFEELLSKNPSLDIHRIIVYGNSPVVGQTLREFSSKHLDDESIISGWMDGEFVVSPKLDTNIKANSVFFVTGGMKDDIEAVDVKRVLKPTGESVLVCGYGKIGRSVEQEIRSTGMDTTVVDIDENKEPDILGDINDIETFMHIDFENFKSIVITVEDDVTATYACTIVRSMYENLRIVCRSNDLDSVQNMYLAGADQVVSIPKIKGSYWSFLLREKERYAPHSESIVREIVNNSIEDSSLIESKIGEKTGARVIALKDGESWITDGIIDAKIDIGDKLIVAGTEDELDSAEKLLQEK